jgi:cation transporter-like permease
MRPLAKLPGLSVWLSVMSQSESAVRSRLGARTSGMILLLLIDRAFFLRTENMIAPAGVLSSSY